MDLFERVLFFVIGAGVGFILGYVVARLRIIEIKVDAVKTEIHEVDEIVKHERNERGALRLPSLLHAMMGVVFVIVVAASFSTARVNAQLDDTVDCLTQFNTIQNEALSSRDDAIEKAATAEIELWTLYQKLYDEATQPDIPPEDLKRLQDELTAAIVAYRDNLVEVQKIRKNYEYDDPDVLKTCERKKDE